MSANETQVGGDHYKSKAIQPWDYIYKNDLGFFEGNVVKYLTRYRSRGGVNDLMKAKHYLEKLIEIAQAEEPTPVPTVEEVRKASKQAPYGYKADGTPYVRRPRNWKGRK